MRYLNCISELTPVIKTDKLVGISIWRHLLIKMHHINHFDNYRFFIRREWSVLRHVYPNAPSLRSSVIFQRRIDAWLGWFRVALNFVATERNLEKIRGFKYRMNQNFVNVKTSQAEKFMRPWVINERITQNFICETCLLCFKLERMSLRIVLSETVS